MTQTIDVTGLAEKDVELIRQLAERMRVQNPSPDSQTSSERLTAYNEAIRSLHEMNRDITRVVEFDRGEIYYRDTP